MPELLPDHLSSAEFNTSDQPTNSKSKPHEVNNIVDWIQCFGIYMAIVSHHLPQRIADLFGYRSLLRTVKRATDRRSHLKASATKNTKWSTYDVTIWNQVFPDSVIVNYQSGHPQPTNFTNSGFQPSRQPLSYKRQICLNWNKSPNGCTHSPCRFKHTCYKCAQPSCGGQEA